MTINLNKVPVDYGIVTNPNALSDMLTPMSIKSYINWIPVPRRDKKPLKKPVQLINEPDTHLTIAEALSLSSRIGLVCDTNHHIVALDVDGVDLATEPLRSLLMHHPTYMEQSPSKAEGYYRLIYQLSSSEAKLILKNKATASISGQGDVELYNASRNYVTLTGDVLPNSLDYVALIAPESIIKAFPSFARNEQATVTRLHPTLSHSINRAGLVPPSVWVENVPCDEFHPLVQKYLAKHETIYHDYWLQGIMALHYTFGEREGYELAQQWSQSSDDYDEEELHSRWKSLTSLGRYQAITERTYQFMYSECVIDWPVANKKGAPSKDEFSNTVAFMDYQGLSIAVDSVTTTPFIKGAIDTVVPTYYDTAEKYYTGVDSIEKIAAKMTFHVREHNYMPKPHTVASHLTQFMLKQDEDAFINRMSLWLGNEPEYDPDTEDDYLLELGRDIIQRDPEFAYPSQEFHNLLVKKWMLSLVRTFGYSRHNSTAEGMVILSGPPKCGKSSLSVRLLPKMFQHLHVSTIPNFSGRSSKGQNTKDYKAATTASLIVAFDEAENVVDPKINSDAEIKAEVTASSDTFRPAYGRTMITKKRQYSIYSSTNLKRLPISEEGDRRYWWLNVKYVDTYLLDDYPVDRMWKQMEYILKHEKGELAPWLLTDAEVKYLSGYLANHRSTNSLDEVLMDVYDWDALIDHAKEQENMSVTNAMKTVPQVITELKFQADLDGRVNRKALNHSLVRLCKQFAPAKALFKNTIVDEGHLERSRQKLFLLPPLRDQYQS